MAVCWSLIDFEATTPWQNTPDKQRDIKLMIGEILSYQQTYKSAKGETEQFNSYELQAQFLNHICVEEGVGLKNKSDTIALLQEIHRNQPKRQNSDHKSELKRQLSHTEQETKNVYDAWLHFIELKHKHHIDDLSLVNVETCVLKPHKILMKNVLDPKLTPGGQFSTLERKTTYKGKEHVYPKFKTELEVGAEVQRVVDRFNALINAVKKLTDPEERMYKTFKCAAYLLFNLISIHPFSDGNGRICRLICSYVLSLFFPFPSPIYNVYSPTDKSDYVNGIVAARERKPSHPQELTGLMIESNYHVWKNYFAKMQTEKLEDKQFEMGECKRAV